MRKGTPFPPNPFLVTKIEQSREFTRCFHFEKWKKKVPKRKIAWPLESDPLQNFQNILFLLCSDFPFTISYFFPANQPESERNTRDCSIFWVRQERRVRKSLSSENQKDQNTWRMEKNKEKKMQSLCSRKRVG